METFKREPIVTRSAARAAAKASALAAARAREQARRQERQQGQEQRSNQRNLNRNSNIVISINRRFIRDNSSSVSNMISSRFQPNRYNRIRNEYNARTVRQNRQVSPVRMRTMIEVGNYIPRFNGNVANGRGDFSDINFSENQVQEIIVEVMGNLQSNNNHEKEEEESTCLESNAY